MLRTIFVLSIFAYGIYYSLRSPFNALLLYLWVAHFRPQDWAWAEWLNAVPFSLIAAVVVIGYTLLVHRRYSMTPLQGLMLLFCMAGGLSTWQSVAYDYSWLWYQSFVKMVLISYVLSLLVDDLKKFRLAVGIICLSLGAEAAKQGLVNLFFYPGAPNINEISHLGDNNGVGLGMTMLLALIIGLYQASQKRWEKVALLVLGTGVFMRGITTYSRGAFVTMAVLLVLMWLQNRKKLRNAVAIGLVVVAIGTVMPDRYYERISTIAQVTQQEGISESSAASRLYLWELAFQMANDYPLTGVGFNAYSEAYDWYDTLHVYGEKRVAHGSLPGVFADTGYIGGTIYMLMLLVAYRYMSRIKRQSRYLPEHGLALRHYANALQNALVCFLVGGAFLSFMYYEIVWHLMGLCAALSLIARQMLAEQHHALALDPTPDPTPTRSLGMPGIPALARQTGR